MIQLRQILTAALLFTFLLPSLLIAQSDPEPERPAYMIVTTLHWNFNLKDGSKEDWEMLEKEYFEHVTMKNEYIVNSIVLTHFFTADNTEVKYAATYKSWEDIDKAAERTNELIMEHWPDSAGRAAYFQKRNAYYLPQHSDEIYRILPGAKLKGENEKEPLIYYVRVSHSDWPDDGTNEEINGLHQELLDNVIHKNKYYQAYYVYSHAWGADNREITEVFVLGSLGELEMAFDENEKLSKDTWSDEEWEAFNAKYGRYWTGFHADYIYQSIPFLIK